MLYCPAKAKFQVGLAISSVFFPYIPHTQGENESGHLYNQAFKTLGGFYFPLKEGLESIPSDAKFPSA